ncbi:LIM-domain binding protein-domain-containing protein [Mycena floridula]|nr:LIM-domain binding protein-domain-containing protein [Mycena floridula]
MNQPMLSLTPSFPGGQPQQMGINNPNAPMGMLGPGPQNPNGQRYPMQMNPNSNLHHHQQPRPMVMRPGQNGQPSNQMVGAHMAGLGHMGFQNPGLPQGPQMVRRVASQPQLNQGAPHMGPMPQANMPMGMNAQTSMPAQLRAAQNQQAAQHQIRQLGQMPGEMGLGGMRQGNLQNGGRPNQQQLMNSLSQPPSIQSPQNNFGPMQHQGPPLSSSPRPGSLTPNMTMGGPGPQSRHGDDFMYGGNPQFQAGPSNPNRLSSSGGSFPFVPVPSSTPPIPLDMSQPMQPGMGNNQPGAQNRSGFPLTPAQQFEQMQHSNDNYPPFGIGHPTGPPRPPSNSHQLPPQHHSSPDPLYPQRPLSAARPNSQSGPPPQPSRPTQPQAQANQVGHVRVPSMTQQPQSQQPLPIAPRPPAPGAVGSLGSSPASSTTQSSSDQPPNGTVSVPRPQPALVTLALGNGQGLIRLLQFSGNLSNESKTKLQLSWWNDLIKEYFTPKAIMKFTLWRDNQRNEAKPFEIGVPILPRFFLVTTQSGVKSMTLTLDGARERMFSHGHAIVECVTAVWTYRYTNGYIVTLRGPLTAHVVITSPHPPGSSQTTGNYILKFEDFQFDANFHDKYISLDSIAGPKTIESPKQPSPDDPPIADDPKKWDEPRLMIKDGSIPGEPVNAFGIPQATMRCLELAESVVQMTDLITFANDATLGPLDALSRFSNKIKESQGFMPGASMNPMIHMNGLPSLPLNGIPQQQLSFAPYPDHGSTLYSSAPQSITNPQGSSNSGMMQNQNSGLGTNSAMSSPQNAPPSAQNSPQKQHKTIPGSATSSGNTPASSANTPALTNASLKRKSGADATSPTTATSTEQPPKRATRKRGRTQGG